MNSSFHQAVANARITDLQRSAAAHRVISDVPRRRRALTAVVTAGVARRPHRPRRPQRPAGPRRPLAA